MDKPNNTHLNIVIEIPKKIAWEFTTMSKKYTI